MIPAIIAGIGIPALAELIGGVLGKIDNPVEVLERNCSDLTLTVCGAPARYQILRQIEIH